MMNEFWNYRLLNNTVQIWLIALATLTASIILIMLVKRIVLRRLKKWSLKTTNNLDDLIVGIFESSLIPVLYLSAIYFSLGLLAFIPSVDRVLHVGFLFAVTFFILRMITALVKHFVFRFIHQHEHHEAKEKQARGLIILVNVAIWILGIVFLIDNLGYDVTTLVAGLGIGGIAIALAAQAILGDLFSYFVIFFDRPFEIGDFIIVEDKLGTVEYVGIKTTRLRTLNGEQLICSNTYLTNARVHNYKRMEERRVVFKIGLVYQTPHGQLKRIPGMVKAIIEARSDVRYDRGHFSGFGDFSLDFEFVYYILSPDYNVYMDRQQEIYLDIVEQFEQEGIEFAYPTQSLIVQPVSSESVSGRQARPL